MKFIKGIIKLFLNFVIGCLLITPFAALILGFIDFQLNMFFEFTTGFITWNNDKVCIAFLNILTIFIFWPLAGLVANIERNL